MTRSMITVNTNIRTVLYNREIMMCNNSVRRREAMACSLLIPRDGRNRFSPWASVGSVVGNTLLVAHYFEAVAYYWNDWKRTLPRNDGYNRDFSRPPWDGSIKHRLHHAKCDSTNEHGNDNDKAAHEFSRPRLV